MKTSIVIPAYNRYDLLHQLLWDLYQNCRDNIDEVVIVDNGSDAYFQDGLRGFWFAKNLLPLKLLHIKDNIGFLRASNRGMEHASGYILILISTDVRVQDNFILSVRDVISNKARVLIGNRLLTGDTGWNTFNGKTFEYLEGWILACTKDIWRELGGFDERFAPYDYEDIDLSTTAVSKNVLLFSMNNPRVEHIGAQTIGYNPEREAITLRNKELFKKKWIK